MIRRLRSNSLITYLKNWNLLEDEEGLGMVEIAIIIVIIIGLAIFFREQISALLETIFLQITADVGNI